MSAKKPLTSSPRLYPQAGSSDDLGRALQPIGDAVRHLLHPENRAGLFVAIGTAWAVNVTDDHDPSASDVFELVELESMGYIRADLIKVKVYLPNIAMVEPLNGNDPRIEMLPVFVNSRLSNLPVPNVGDQVQVALIDPDDPYRGGIYQGMPYGRSVGLLPQKSGKGGKKVSSFGSYQTKGVLNPG